MKSNHVQLAFVPASEPFSNADVTSDKVLLVLVPFRNQLFEKIDSHLVLQKKPNTQLTAESFSAPASMSWLTRYLGMRSMMPAA